MRLVVLAAVLIFAGCKTGPDTTAPATPPEVTSQELQVQQELTDFTVKLVGKLKSPDAAMIEKASFELVVDGKVVHTGEQRLNVAVPAGGEAGFEIGDSAKYVANADELKAMDARSGTLPAALRGKLAVRHSGKLDLIDFARGREVRVPRLPHVKMQAIDGARYADNEANLTFSLGVDNPNPFPIRLDGLDYKVSVAGKQMTDGVLGRGEKVDSSSTGVFEVQVAVNPDTWGKDVDKLIKTLKLHYEVSGDLKADLVAEAYDLKGDLKLNVSK